MPGLVLVLIVGRYARDWHRPAHRAESLTETIGRWRDLGAGTLVLPHPSPRNNRWLARNPWFAEALLPELRATVASALAGDARGR